MRIIIKSVSKTLDRESYLPALPLFLHLTNFDRRWHIYKPYLDLLKLQIH